jgi:Family of unknown function (DUF6345)
MKENIVTKKAEAQIKSPSVAIENLKSPFAHTSKDSLGANPANNTYGFSSIQDFSGVFGNHNSDLFATHGDAIGFHNYLHNFVEHNFWFKDGNVKTWQYSEPFDHWQNKYGVDAVMAFYHSGHGNMDANGVFQAPMGGEWNGETWFLSNNKVKLANQVCRYIFWSTCLSCRVLGVHNPVRTWWNSDNNPGFRMLFGFETISIDSPDYGTNFWNHWKNGESFSTAWLNASWDIHHNQAPSCVASGTNATDANNRLFNERFFDWNAVARNYYSWRWYYASGMVAKNKALPKQLKIAEFETQTFSTKTVTALANTLAIKGALKISSEGESYITSNNQSIALNKLGHLNVKLGVINHNNKKAISEKEAIKIAEEQIKLHELNAGEKYAFDVVRLSKVCGGKGSKTPKLDEEYVSDVMVQFRQIVNGVPVVNADAGLIRITIDNDKTVVNLHSSVKKVKLLSSQPKEMMIDPKDEKTLSTATNMALIEKAFLQNLHQYNAPAELVADTDEIGYDLVNHLGKLVNQRVYELSFEKGLKKLVKVVVPIFG